MESPNVPQDEISRLAAQEGAAVGVHRAPARVWTRVLAGFAIFLIAGGATYGYFFAKSHADEYDWLSWLAGSEPTVTAAPSPTFSPEPSPSPSPSVSPSPTVTEDPPDYRFKTKITVYNNTKTKALAAKVRDIIKENAEFSRISTGNWDGAKPPSNVIRYNNEELRDTVELLAEILGIKVVAFGLTEETPIEIVLVEDPDPDWQPQPAPSPSS